MALGLIRSLDTYGHALTLRAQRAEVLGFNITNSDTPGYQARDFDFAAAMGRASQGSRSAETMRASRPGHITATGAAGGPVELGYRVPLQLSLDQNTVETHVEQAAFSENAVRYQATVALMNSRIRNLLTAVTGK